MTHTKTAAPALEHRDGHKNAGLKSTKTRTTILLAAAGICNWLVGELGLALLLIFGVLPLLGLLPWLPLPLIGGALLAVSAGLIEEAISCER